ncbi:MAG TPA: NAD(P)H-binding protein [Ktedonobacterales bacterium]|nr:NAD(P)H-binding protein [Ktedonobacterales bacterium]
MILVTGAGGFVGSRVVARLAGEGEPVRALVRDLERAKQRLPASGVELVRGDTTRPETLDTACAGIDTVVHSAFITAERKQGPGINYYATNVEGTANLVAAAKRAGVRRIVVASGLGTKPSAPGSYMQGRYLAEQEVKRSGLGWSILGPSVQFGAGSAFINGLADLIRQAPIVPMIGSGKRLFQPIWVEDVTTCLVKMVREPAVYDGKSLEVGGPGVYTYARILDMLMEVLGKRKPKLAGPLPLAALGARMMEAVLPKPPITSAAIGLFTFDNVTAPDSVQRNFGFTPLSLPSYLAEHGLN